MQWFTDVSAGPHNLSPIQIWALDAIDRETRHSPARGITYQTSRSLIRKGLLSFHIWRGPRGGRHAVWYLTEAGRAEMARIGRELESKGY